MLPKIGDAIGAIRARECFLQALDVVEIRLNDFRALRGKGLPVPRSFIPQSPELPENTWSYDPEAQLLMLHLRHTGKKEV